MTASPNPLAFWRGLLYALPLSGLIWLLLVAGVARAAGEPYTAEDTLQAIEQASSEIGVSTTVLYRIVGCETGGTFEPYSVGDHGSSFGPVQLHRGGGELARFYRWGYTDVYSPYQSVRFLAQEIGFGRAGAWSCR